MFNFFNKKKDKEAIEQASAPEWIKALSETQQRLFAFLDKLEDKMKELTEAAIPELNAMKQEDERDFGNLMNGIMGQLESVREKAQTTYEEKVESLYDSLSDRIDVFDRNYDHLSDFRHNCSDRRNAFEEKLHFYQDLIRETARVDYEVLYKSILDEHERIKNQFKCLQCSSIIPLTKIYFITTHISCPACNTKNTFHPSTQASRLEDVGRGLAEQRTQHLLDKYNQEQKRERDLYHQAHEQRLTGGFNVSATVQTQINELEEQRKASEALAPQLYKEYQRAMFDEWKKLVPDLAEQTENYYRGLQK